MLSYSFAAFAGTEETSQHRQEEESSSSSVIIESSRDFFEAPDTQVGFWGEAEGFLSRFRHFILRYSSSRNITIKRILLLLLRTEEQQALLLLYCSLATQTASSSSTKSSVPLRLSRCCYCVLVVGLLLLLLLYEKVSSQTVDSQLSSKRELRSGKSCSCVP